LHVNPIPSHLKMAEPTPPTDIANTILNSKKPEDLPWFRSELTEDMIDSTARELFENYCKIPPADVIPHIKQFVRLISPPLSS